MTWDANGNLLEDQDDTKFTYDTANRLIEVVQDGITYTMRYNGVGDRVEQAVNGEVTTYILDLFGGLTQVLADGTNSYLYGLGRIGEEQPGGWAYHLADALGSVRQLADADGYVTMVQSFKPYGGVLEREGEGATNYSFTGEWADDIDMIYLRARYYDPKTGRFLIMDPWEGLNQQPRTAERARV